MEETFQCTSAQCGGLFIAVFQNLAPNASGTPKLTFMRSIPVEAQPPAVGQSITELSPPFFETYCQALAAEGAGFSQLTGIGLRKALEFLVKDFAISSHPSEREEILVKPLASCINQYIDDANTKAVAERAAWLGNDETHYVRRWDDKDIEDLKVLIRLAINGVENVLLTRKYLAEMPTGKK